jgi:glycerol-1-phosphate dehydrogenase [NAD(P)+]
VHSRWPDAVLIDIDVLSHAPAELNRAGLGDLLSMFTAPADWLLASTIGMGVPFDAGLVAVVRSRGERLLELAGEIGDNDPEALGYLAEVLTLSGQTMGLAGATAPSSGLEHVISHLLEMTSTHRGDRPALHGQQVGVGAIVAAAVWRRVLTTAPSELPPLRVPGVDAARNRVLHAFRPLGDAAAQECWTAYSTKLRYLHDHPGRLDVLRARWPWLVEQIAPMLAEPGELATALRRSGAPTTFAELAPQFDQATVRWAVRNGHRMRDRFVVSDLAELMGLWDAELVDDALAALDPER